MSTVTPRKRAPRRAAAPKPVEDMSQADFDAEIARLSEPGESPIGEDGSIRPVRIGKRGRTPNEMVTIFTLDDVDYQIPAKPSPMVLIRFMREARNRKIGVAGATENLLIGLLGQDAVDALAGSPEVTEQDVADVFAIVSHIAFGAVKKLQAAADPS